jgi:drug/metabolite transporter (DMT)-like permease
VSSIVLSVKDTSAFSFSAGSLFILLACICWGFENNCTRMMSSKDPVDIVIIKGLGSGIGSLAIALAIGETMAPLGYIMSAMLLGFTAYGLSIFFYIYAQRELGAAKTSTYYAVAPFIGVAFSLIMFQEIPSLSFILALVIMIVGTYFAVTDVHAS